MPRFELILCALAIVSQASSGAQAQPEIKKQPLETLRSKSCDRIAKDVSIFAAEHTTKTTQYFTPIFSPGNDGVLQGADRYNCLKMEGSCIVGRYLYNAGGISGTRYDLDKILFRFGKGNGATVYNTTNALFPCRTLAADLKHYKIGTVIYISAFVGKICPQNGQPVDGCFVVGDVGSAIKGKGRFDIFTGECAQYDSNKHVCRDLENRSFNVPIGTQFYNVPLKTELAGALRTELDTFIQSGWKQ